MLRELLLRLFRLRPATTPRSEPTEEDKSTLAHLVKLLGDDEVSKVR
jgi:hypothetical protein